jgi:hypothetical protein
MGAGAAGAVAGVSTASSTRLDVFIDFIVRAGTGRIAWVLSNVLRQFETCCFGMALAWQNSAVLAFSAAAQGEVVYDPPLGLRAA